MSYFQALLHKERVHTAVCTPFLRGQNLFLVGCSPAVLTSASILTCLRSSRFFLLSTCPIYGKPTDPADVYQELLKNLEYIRSTSKKIGNSQRRYFYHFFKSLLNLSGENKLNVDSALKKARKMYNVEFL